MTPAVPCVYCGRAPAAAIELRAHTGMVVMARYSTVSGEFCRQCGTALFRNRMDHTLARGWWGVVAFFLNFYAITKNLMAWFRLRSLDPPTGQPHTPPIPNGHPVWARSGFYVAVALFLAGNLLIDADQGRPDVAGRCVNLAREGMKLVDCDDFHDGVVLNLVTSTLSCAEGTDEAVKLRRDGPAIACVDLDR